MTTTLQPLRSREIFDNVAPRTFDGEVAHGNAYMNDPAIRKLADFFETKGLAALKDEDLREAWYDDWLAYQAEHGLYASLLSPSGLSTRGSQFDLLRLTRFLEVFGYFSPAHGYSLQVSFLGLFSILMGTNHALKAEAIKTLEAGGLFAFGVSEKNHGSDLLGNEFSIRPAGGDRFVADGSKYYIGNANCASMVTILARKEDERSNGRARRAPMALVVLRPKASPGYGNIKKIRTHGVRAAFVGSFDVKDHELPASDIIAEGRDAWEAVFGTISLGKFFLGFGAIGICEHAFAEASAHLNQRVLFGNPVIQMPHIRLIMAQAYARLCAMKLYAYRALDYVRGANAEDRRYLLFTAVQKAKVSTDGVKVMSLLSECIGARGFETDTYFEMALRDAQLIPGLEGSTHINLGMATQFMPAYFAKTTIQLAEPKPVEGENPYLFKARTTSANTVRFSRFLEAYRPLTQIENVRIFVRQAKAFSLLMKSRKADADIAVWVGQCFARIVYGQLVAESAVRQGITSELIAAMFHMLVSELSAATMALLAMPQVGVVSEVLRRRLIVVPRTAASEWEAVALKAEEMGKSLPL